MATIRRMLRPSEPIRTERLLLRPFTVEDLDAVAAIVGRDDVNRYLYAGPRTRAEAAAALEQLRANDRIDESHDSLVLAAEHPEHGVIGYVLLRLTSREHRQGEIGYVVHPDHHGHGYATEAAAVMLRLGFEELDLHRIVAQLDARNAASARVAVRLGMRREAHLRENEFVKGEWADELIFAMLRAEWPPTPRPAE